MAEKSGLKPHCFELFQGILPHLLELGKRFSTD